MSVTTAQRRAVFNSAYETMTFYFSLRRIAAWALASSDDFLVVRYLENGNLGTVHEMWDFVELVGDVGDTTGEFVFYDGFVFDEDNPADAEVVVSGTLEKCMAFVEEQARVYDVENWLGTGGVHNLTTMHLDVWKDSPYVACVGMSASDIVLGGRDGTVCIVHSEYDDDSELRGVVVSSWRSYIRHPYNITAAFVPFRVAWDDDVVEHARDVVRTWRQIAGGLKHTRRF